MSDAYTESTTRLNSEIIKRPWLFKKTPAIPLASYVGYFENRSGYDFFYFPIGLPYKLEILDKYKSKIFNSYFMTIQQGIVFHTIIQVSPTQHVLFMWGNTSTNRETVVYGSIYTSNPSDYVTFMEDNLSLIYTDTPTAGLHFGGAARQ